MVINLFNLCISLTFVYKTSKLLNLICLYIFLAFPLLPMYFHIFNKILTSLLK